MRLYSFKHAPSPLKARLAMAELGLSHETVEVNLFAEEHRQPGFARLNPWLAVPVLEDEGKVLRESNAIVAWLGKRNGTTKGLWPRDPAVEAQALSWLFFEAAHLSQAAGTLWWNDVLVKKINRPQLATGGEKEAAEDLADSLDTLNQHFKDNRYVLGRDFSLVDCAVGVTLDLLRETRLDHRVRWPFVRAYCDAIRDRPSWAQENGALLHSFPTIG